MQVITTTASIILLVSLTKDFAYATNAHDSVRNDRDNDMLKELLERMEKMQRHMDQMERNNKIRFDQIEIRFDKVENHVDKLPNMQNQLDRFQRQIDQMETKNNIGFGQVENDNKNLTVVMETIVEQQMVITAEIFTVSQTLPFCCCHYQNQSSTDAPEIKTTTPKPIKSLITSCAEATEDGVYEFNIKNSNIAPFDVYCMKKFAKLIEENVINGTWMIIQRRQDSTTDFNRNWNTYKHGFGDLKGSFWIGLDKLYALTKSTPQELWVQLEGTDGITAWAKYSHFGIENEDDLYALRFIDDYVGTAGDSLRGNKFQKWSTFDKDNDAWADKSCAKILKGAWWFAECGDSRLNGVYDGENLKIMWITFPGSQTYKYVHMAIRPKT